MTTEQAGYLYDVFVSYRNQGDVQNWVVNRFIPELRNSLEVMMPVGWAKKHKNIFVDSESIKAGENWEVKLHSSLKQSRILIAILTTGYEDSDWCKIEWETFAKRKELFGDKLNLSKEQQLIIPITYVAPHRISESFKVIQYYDFSNYTDPPPIWLTL